MMTKKEYAIASLPIPREDLPLLQELVEAAGVSRSEILRRALRLFVTQLQREVENASDALGEEDTGTEPL